MGNPTEVIDRQAAEARRKPPDEIAEPCKYDAVMIICYTMQKIVVPYSALGAGDDATNQRVFANIVTRALSNRNMKVINTTPSIIHGQGRLEIEGLGHAGVCILNGQEEKAYYYEFGRYDPEQNGKVQYGKTFGSEQRISFNEQDPVRADLQKLCDVLRKTNYEKGVNFKSAYVKTICGTANIMKNYAENQKSNGRAKYDLDGNHCMTFAIDVANAGGVDVSSARNCPGFEFTDSDKVIVESEIDNAPVGVMGTIATVIGQGNKVQEVKDGMKAEAISKASDAMGKMQVPSLQMDALQKVYKILNHAPFQFEGFPSRPYEKKS